MATVTKKQQYSEPLVVPTLRSPQLEDGKSCYKLAKQSGTLDVNSEYAYVLLAAHFADTCAYAEVNGIPAGFLNAYIPPQKPHTLFVWQVAVANRFQGQGIAQAMLKHILDRPQCNQLRIIETTVTATNQASRALFASVANSLGTSLHEQAFFTHHHFSPSHEEEPLLTIGPFDINKNRRKK